MYSPGAILYFTPFYFSNGNSCKNKYFIVLGVDGDDMVIASLPTSKDHVPENLTKTHRCINNDAMRINCYFFEKNRKISECGKFSFPMDTYLYGEHIQSLSRAKLEEIYPLEGKDFISLGLLNDIEFKALKLCLRNSGNVKNKLKKYL
jgi:hypothetical protein